MFLPPPNNGFGLLRGVFPGAEEMRVIRSVKKVKFPARLPRFPAEGVLRKLFLYSDCNYRVSVAAAILTPTFPVKSAASAVSLILTSLPSTNKYTVTLTNFFVSPALNS